jgi:hypothetical protein
MSFDGATALEQIDETTALLVRARSFVERGWCRYSLALNDTGQMTEPKSDRAVAWCMYGAMEAAGWPYGQCAHPAFCRLKAAINGEWVCDFNNQQETVEPVLAAFDRAIAAEATRCAS